MELNAGTNKIRMDKSPDGICRHLRPAAGHAPALHAINHSQEAFHSSTILRISATGSAALSTAPLTAMPRTPVCMMGRMSS